MENVPAISASEQFTGLPMRDLIGGPLMAAADANSAMGLSQTKFLLKTCFKKEGENHSPIMVGMKLTRGFLTTDNEGNPKIQDMVTTFSVPLLTLIPLNSLAVDDVNVQFHMEVKSSYGEEEKTDKTSDLHAEGSLEGSLGWGPMKVSIKGSVTKNSTSNYNQSSHYDTSSEATYDVKVHARQIPLPEGVSTIIQAFTSAIEPTKLPTSSTSTTEPTFKELVQAGDALFKAGDYTGALKKYQKAEAIEANDPDLIAKITDTNAKIDDQ